MKKRINSYWWDDKEKNFGDQLSPYMIEKLSGKSPLWTEAAGRLLAIGSIMIHVKDGDTVWGSGIQSIEENHLKALNVKGVKFAAVRGPLTRDILLEKGATVPEIYGDPAILLPDIYSPVVELEHKIGIIPHCVDRDLWHDLADVHVIDITLGIEEFIDQVLSCEKIISSSLHGIIVAEAYGKPAAFVKLSDKIIGGDFKFHDYYASTGRDPVDPLDWTHPGKIDIKSAETMMEEIKSPVFDREKLRDAFPRSPTIVLNMVSKNDAPSLQRLLPTIRNQIDYYVIGLDEDNTDNTEEVIQKALSGIPGEIISLPWEGWGKTRTASLRAADHKADFALLVDADTTVTGLDADALSLDFDAYNLVNINGDLRYYTPRLVKADGQWDYVGRTHEYLRSTKGSPSYGSLNEASVKHFNTGSNRKVKSKRDEELLLLDLEDNPTNVRTLFYLGQTYQERGDFATAILYYERRVDSTKGWFEEKWQAQYRIAEIHISARSPWTMVEEALLAAHELNPKRPEPLFHLGKYYYDADNHQKAYGFFMKAVDGGLPTSFLFRDESAVQKSLEYLTVSAYHSGHFIEGLKAGLKALQSKKNYWNRDQLQKNLYFYIDKI